MASVQIFDPEQGALQLLAWTGFHPESAASWKWVRFDSSSSCGLAFSSGRRVVVPDTETCAFLAGTTDLDEYRRSNIRAVQSTSLVSRSGQLLGMISTHWCEPHQPAERALGRLDVLARLAVDLTERGNAARWKRRCAKAKSDVGGSPQSSSPVMTQLSARLSMASSQV